MKQQDDVRDFMLAAGQECHKVPTVVPPETRILRAKLILEEALEQCTALGIEPYIEYANEIHQAVHCDAIDYREGGTLDLVEVADGIADQLYVSLGCAVALGINMEPIWEIVQASNMAKFGPGSFKRPDGKQMKPPDWTPPTDTIREELKRQCLST